MAYYKMVFIDKISLEFENLKWEFNKMFKKHLIFELECWSIIRWNSLKIIKIASRYDILNKIKNDIRSWKLK